MSTVIGCQRLESLEVVGNAKFDDAIVFNALSMSGDSMSVSVSGDLSFVSSAGSATLMVQDNVTVDAVDGTVWLQAGVDTASDGAVVVRHGSGTPVIHFLYDFTADEDRLGFFGSTPVVQPTGVAVTDVAIHAALVTLGLITA